MFQFQTAIRGKTDAANAPLLVSFDEVLTALQQLNRMFIEPDGSFVWTGVAADGDNWQVDGNLIDRGNSLAYVELKGRCPEAELDKILGAIGWPKAPLAFELTRQGLVVDELEFRRLAASHTGAV